MEDSSASAMVDGDGGLVDGFALSSAIDRRERSSMACGG